MAPSEERESTAVRREHLLLFLQTCPNRLNRPWFLRKLARLELRVNQVAVNAQLEPPASGRYKLQLTNLLLVRGQELARQTDGLRLVISHRTVLEFYVHIFSLIHCL